MKKIIDEVKKNKKAMIGVAVIVACFVTNCLIFFVNMEQG